MDTAPPGPPGPTAAAAAPPSRAGRDLTRAIPVGVGLGALVIASIAFTPRAWYTRFEAMSPHWSGSR